MNITRPYKLFLLGGYDLEMLTIKQLLKGVHDCVVIDKQLKWDNAHLSEYQDELQTYVNNNIYGIELQEDITPPINYHRVDHHNDWDDKPSVLEQVAQLVDIQLNRYQQLVAANDKGYIPAMQQLSATVDEIADIRKRDRFAQGITAEEEMLGEKSISENLGRRGPLTIVKSLISHFSPICDRLYPYQRLLVYNDFEWMYYGEGKKNLIWRFANEIAQKKVFYGGGVNGYVGSVSHSFSKAEIDIIVEQIIKEYGNI